MFRRKKWKYLILDEAHMIKNWKSQRWQTLLNFNSKRRLLLTGTPLQNDLMELWSLMHFLMPHVFTSHAQFKDWFSNPLTGMVQGESEVNQVIKSFVVNCSDNCQGVFGLSNLVYGGAPTHMSMPIEYCRETPCCSSSLSSSKAQD